MGGEYLEEMLQYEFEVRVYRMTGCSGQCKTSFYSIDLTGSGNQTDC